MPEQEFLPPRPPGGFRRPAPKGPYGPAGSGGPEGSRGPEGPRAPEGSRGPEGPRAPEGSRGDGGYYGEDPPPWAGLPPVRPARPDYPRGPSSGPAAPRGPAEPPRPAGPYRPGEPPRPAGPPRTAEPPRQAGPPGLAEPPDEDEVPPWAGPDALDEDDVPRARPRARPSSQGPGTQGPGARRAGNERPGAQRPDAQRPGSRGSRAQGGRAQRAAARRRRRWLITLVGLVVVAGSVTAVALLRGGPAPAPVTPGALITTFQPGELQSVPNACGTVPAATVQRYLPGKLKVASPLPIDGAAESACDWTIDQQPVYRLMQLNLLAYAPNGLASGNGSATDAAIDAYAMTLANMQDPPKDSADPRAAVTSLGGLGNEAFSAVQVFRRGGAVTDVATVVIRFHNVIVTATLNALDHSNSGNYGPVSVSELSAAALAFAQAGEATLH